LEQKKENGNVRISEIGILAAIASSCEDNTIIFEIGTFDGRTTLNLSSSSPKNCKILTLDLPPDTETRYSIDDGERLFVEKPKPGACYEKYRKTHPQYVDKIVQLLGDSATFDYSPYIGRCSLVFVDGSHTYDYTIHDMRVAMKLLKKDGIVICHDYGIWEGVTKALEDLEQRERLDLKNISGTSLVYWKKAYRE
jgi:predicted O-methyltransferase YrrM